MKKIYVIVIIAALLWSCSGRDYEITENRSSRPVVKLQPEAKPEKRQVVNRPPRIVSFKFVPAVPRTGQPVRVDAVTEDPEGDEIILHYEWKLNGELLPAVDGDTLDIRTSRGDVISVKVTPADEYSEGIPVTSMVKVANAYPVIKQELRDISIAGEKCRASVMATDPDDDALSYSLVKAPPDMTIDGGTGLLQWDFRNEESPPFDLVVSVKDGLGAESRLKTRIEGCYAENEKS